MTDLVALQHDVLPRLDWPRQRPGGALAHRATPFAGLHRGIAAARGLEFRELRQYAQGDDSRLIDWRQTARRGRPFVRMLGAERDHALWLGLAEGPSMAFASQGMIKKVLAAHAAAWFAWSAVRGGDRVGLLGLAGASGFMPRRGSAGALAVCQALAQKGGAMAGGMPCRFDLVRPGDAVIWIGDFYAEGVLDDLAPLTRRAYVGLVQVVDSLEAEAPPPARYPVGDESGRIAYVDTRDPLVRSRWGEALRARNQRLDDWCALHAVSRLCWPTTSTPPDWRRAIAGRSDGRIS